MFEFWAVLVIYTFSLSFGQFPKECTLDKEVFDFECCPNTTLGVCGGPTRGSCVDITNKYAEGQCEKGNNSNSTYCLAQEFLKNRPGTNRTDFRYNWPTQIFHKVCNCSGNYDGYNCMRCKRGYTGESCSHSQVVVRKNVLNLTKRELDRFLEVLQTIKTSNTSGYTVAIIEPVTRESRDSFSEISLFDLFASFHFNAARDEDINSCNKSSTISQFCNVHTPCPVVDYAHEGPALLTWHRKFMLFVETEIQRVLNDSTFGFPYWDWTDEKTRNNIWNIAYMGSSNCGIFAEPPANSNTTQAPINGHFSNWSTICADSQQIVCNTQNQLCNPTKSSGKIQRCIGGTTGVQCRVQKMLPDTREFKIALKQRVYDHVPYHANNNTMGFRNSLEGFNYLIPRNQNVCTHFVEGFSTTELHNRVHIYVGGTMISVPASANDPIFYLHHSNVDRLYEEWLNTFSNKSFPSFQPSNFSYDVDPGHNIDEYLVPFFPTVTNRDMHHRATSFGYTYTQEKVITCPPLAAPDHGSIDCLSEGGRYLIGQLCLFKCDGGYELRGSASRRCQDNCTWNGTNTTCIRDGPPTNINAVTLSPRSIEVTWDPPEAYINDVSAYIILYNGTEGFADDGIVTVNRSSTRAIINGLEEFVSYDITVQAVYDARNIPSNPVRVMTWSDVPDGPPRDITIMDTDPAMLSVRYRPPPASSRNGDVTGYVIRYTRVGSGISQVITISDSSRGLRTSVIPALVAFVNYSGEVAAVNVNGTGPFSDVVYGLSGQDRPATAPRLLTADIIQSRFMTLSWMPPDTPNGIIIQYEVQYSVNSTTLLVNFADTLMGTVEGLSPVTLYTLQIRAYTRVGIGPFSSMITLMTLPEVPTPVPSVTIQSISSSMLTINWMEPDIPNGAITHYTVFYLPVSGPYGPIITSNRRKRQLVQDGEFAMDFTGTSGTLTNLNGSVTYRIQVSAVALNNIVGDRSDEKVIITNQRTPTEPCDIVATGVTQSSISLSWQRPDPPNGLITNYTVSYIAMVTYFNQTTGELGTFSINNSTTVLADDNIILSSLNFTDLRLGTEYQFTIVAYTNVGPGPEAMISVSTLHDVPPTPVILKLSTTDDTTVQIGIQPVPGHVMYYAVIVVIGGDETSSTNVKDISPFNEEEADTANSNDQPYTYITGIVETSDISDYPYPYVVGDESRSSIGGINYENVQLQTNTTYAVLVRAYTTDDLFSTSKALSVTTTITTLPPSLPPTIVAPPKPSVVIAPYSASFSCSATESDSKISWKRQDGKMLPAKAVTATQDTKIDESTTTGFLIISDVTAHDAGEYCCIASNEAGQAESDCVQLTVQIPPPRISMQPEDVTVGQGTSVSLNCEAESYGDTFYHWQRVDGEVDTSRASGINSKQLTIINTVPSDTGSYICVTRNQDGETISREAIITVTAQCPTNLNIQNGFVTVSVDNKLVAYGCYNGYRLVGNTTARCLSDGTWNSEPPMCVADTCTDVGATNCAHFANVDDNGDVLCMCRPGYRVDLLNASHCIDIDECKLESTLCDGECVNTQGSYYCQCPPSFALASDGKTCIECGVSNVAVNGGNSGNVHRRKFSWHVQLCVNATNNNSSFLCSGSLINDQWVLTSAECICGLDYSNILIYLHKLAKCPVTQTNEIVRTISAVYCHIGYQNKIIDYNIALLKLSMPVNGSVTSPVCLPKDTTMRRDFPDFVRGVFVTGWGSSSHLRYSKLSTVPSNICKKSYGGDYDIETNSICTDKYDPDGTCDDGSPMVYQIRSPISWFVMVGIANSKCQATLPYDVYTSTLPATNVLPWIVETTGLHI